MADVYRKERPALSEYTQAFNPVDGQVGSVFVLDGRIAGMECFGRPEAFENAYRKIVESYALDAIDTAKKGVEPKGDSQIAIGALE